MAKPRAVSSDSGASVAESLFAFKKHADSYLRGGGRKANRRSAMSVFCQEATARNRRFDTDQGFLGRYKDTPARERLFGIGRAVFSNILKQACGNAGVPKFVRHQLRHTAGTRIRDAFGIERAQAHLFHSNANMTFL
jgi:integrase